MGRSKRPDEDWESRSAVFPKPVKEDGGALTHHGRRVRSRTKEPERSAPHEDKADRE